MSRPDFREMAWTAHERSKRQIDPIDALAEELERAWELGVSQAVEAVHAVDRAPRGDWTRGLDDAEDAVRALLEKPADPRAS